jgi:imidazoleglycerol-phosphate dehydratase
MTTVRRTTRETDVDVCVGESGEVRTGSRFRDHMLETLAHHAGLPLRVRASGDLPHHVSEDVAIALGAALGRWLPATAARYGHRTVPMDDALVEVSLDTGGRSYYAGGLPGRRWDHFLRSLCENARFTLHVRVLRGVDRHHVIEAAFKALGLALRDASTVTGATFSTKGAVRLEVEGC